MKLSRSFTLEEFTKSTTAVRLGIENVASIDEINNMTLLSEKVLQPLRDAYGHPIIISSGYRCERLNVRIGGSTTSQHCKGQAADIDNGKDNAFFFYYIREHLDFDQVIWEFGDDNSPDWVHVSYKEKNNRKQCLRSVRDEKGKVTYRPYV